MGTYASKSDIENRYGTEVVNEWANLTGTDDSDDINTRVNDAITYAESLVEVTLRQSRYNLPLTSSQSPYIVQIVVRLAGSHLYMAREFSNRRTSDSDIRDTMVNERATALSDLGRVKYNGVDLGPPYNTVYGFAPIHAV